MDGSKINQDWYGSDARIIAQEPDCTVIDYGCADRGIVTNYNLFDGIQLSFLDFDTGANFPSQKFNSDIITISHCMAGRYECEFPNHTMAYLPEGSFSVNGTKYLPVSFSFPLHKYQGLSLVIDKQSLPDGVHRMMEILPIDLAEIGETLELEKHWYVNVTPPKLQHLFTEIYDAKGVEQIGYFRIKAMELLYHIDQLTQNNGCDFKYFDKGQIQATKQIREYLVSHLNNKTSLEQLAKNFHINLSVFHTVFAQIYGDTPYAHIKKYKMNLAAQLLLENKKRIVDIAMELGYSNPSKFAKAFQSVYGVLPKEYRKNK